MKVKSQLEGNITVQTYSVPTIISDFSSSFFFLFSKQKESSFFQEKAFAIDILTSTCGFIARHSNSKASIANNKPNTRTNNVFCFMVLPADPVISFPF